MSLLTEQEIDIEANKTLIQLQGLTRHMWQSYARAIEAKVIEKIKARGPVAEVDANDDGYWADILPDNSVKVGQLLYKLPSEGD